MYSAYLNGFDDVSIIFYNVAYIHNTMSVVSLTATHVPAATYFIHGGYFR